MLFMNHYTRTFSRRPERDVKTFEVIVERHPDGFVAYPVRHRGVVVGEGNSVDEALDDLRSAVRFHIETFGPDALDDERA